MSRGDDLCSMVSTLSSAFTEDDNGWEDEDDRELEMKYVPPEEDDEDEEATETEPGREEVGLKVKVEVDEEELINQYLEEEEEQQEEEEEEEKVVLRRSSRRKGGKAKEGKKRTRVIASISSSTGQKTNRKRRKRDWEDPEEEEPDDWRPDYVRKCRPPGKQKHKRMSEQRQKERRRERARIKARERRANEKRLREERKNSEGLKGDEDGDWVPDGEEEEGENSGSAKKRRRTRPGASTGDRQLEEDRKARKRVANMTPEQVERERQRKRDYRLRQKMMMEELKREEEMEGSSGNDKSVVKVEAREDGDKPGPRKKSRRLADMTPEQAEKERARSRARKERERELRALLKEGETPGKSRSGSESGNTSIGSYRRKLVSEMTAEEKEQIRERWRREAERRRARRAGLTLSGCKREIIDIEERRRRDRERKNLKRMNMTPEERLEEKRKFSEKRRKRLENMTEEQRQEERQRAYFKHQAKLASMTAEERRARNEKIRFYRMSKPRKQTSYAKLLEQIGPEGVRERRRKYYRELDPERKQRFLQQMRDYHKRKNEKLKADPEKWAEVLKGWRETCAQRRKAGLIKKRARKDVRERGPSKRPQSEEQLKLRRIRDKQCRLRKRLEVWKLVASGLSPEEISRRVEEKKPNRENECMRKRIVKAKRELKTQLEAIGTSPEEIAKRLHELEHTYTPKQAFRPYKPKVDNVSEEDISRLEQEIEELEQEAKQLVAECNIRTCIRKRERSTREVPGEIVQQAPVAHQPQIVLPTQQQTPFASCAQQQHTFNYSGGQYSSTPTIAGHYSLQGTSGSMGFQNSALQQSYELTSYEGSTTSSQHEEQYANSSCFDDDAPASPGGNDDTYSESSYQNPSQYQVEPKPDPVPVQAPVSTYSQQPRWQPGGIQPPKRPRGRPRKGTEPSGLPKKIRRIPGPNDERFPNGNLRPTQLLRDPNAKLRRKPYRGDPRCSVVCDECGNTYHMLKLKEHKKQIHNPNYDRANRKCRLCGLTFTVGQTWYKHYLHTHVNPDKPTPEKSYVCEECGKGFGGKHNYIFHMHHMHGEGSKPENFIQCSMCPERFKFKHTYSYHLQTNHPDFAQPEFECFRCELNLFTRKALYDHVKLTHPESFFPCPYCNTCTFTQLGLNFHYRRCTKIGGAERERRRKEWMDQHSEPFNMEEWQICCEFCNRKLALCSMNRHYLVVHKVTEDEFQCGICKRMFKQRQFWANHLEERHQQSLAEIGAHVHKLNAVNREGLSTAAFSRKNNKRRKKKVEKKKGKKRRNIVVICEEDELEGNTEQKKKKKKKPEVKVKRKRKESTTTEESISEEEEEDSSWSESE